MANPQSIFKSSSPTIPFHAPTFWPSPRKSQSRLFISFALLRNGDFFPISTSSPKATPPEWAISQVGRDLMGYPHDLLAFARQIAELHPIDAHQPSLRRAISTAYYALFHLLISDAVGYCGDPQLANALSRVFEHGGMKSASDSKVSEINSLFDPKPPGEPERTTLFHIHNVAETFGQAQNNRLDADYNLAREWQPSQVSLLVEGIESAFKSWEIVRNEQPAKDYLLSMLPTRERKQPQPPKPGKAPKRQKPRPSLGTPPAQ